MTPEKLTVRAVLVRNNKSEERQTSVLRTTFTCLTSKVSLLDFVFDELYNDLNIARNAQNFKIERKSKKHKRFVVLECSDDFKELMRSVKVKNHVKLVIYKIETSQHTLENAVTDALDQVKKLVGELQKSELWEILRSFTTTYNMQLAPDGDSGSDLQDIDSKSVDKGNDEIFRQSVHKSNNDVVHEFVACDSCHPADTFGNIHGKRYKCVVCDNFDLCEQCYSSNVAPMGHLRLHPMLIIPDSRLFKDYYYPRMQFHNTFRNHCTESLSSKDAECSEILTQKLGADKSAVFSDLEKCLDDSKRYSELAALVDDSSDKFETLKQIVSSSVEFNSSNISEKPDVNSDGISKNPEVSPRREEEAILFRNDSIYEVPDGEFIFECYSEDGCKVWSQEHDMSELVHPGSTFSLDFFGLSTPFGSEIRVVHSESGFRMCGFYSGKVVNLLIPDSIISEGQEGQLRLEGGEIEVTVIPKGTTLSQVIVANKSESEFDCADLIFEIVNCFGKVVATVSAHRKHSLLPGRIAKFNILVNNTHFKYPFKLDVNNGVLRGSCELSLKCLSGTIKLSQIKNEKSCNELSLSTVSLFTGEKNSSAFDESSETGLQQDVTEDSETDFDLISLADVEEILSDFEVLSNVNSLEA